MLPFFVLVAYVAFFFSPFDFSRLFAFTLALIYFFAPYWLRCHWWAPLRHCHYATYAIFCCWLAEAVIALRHCFRCWCRQRHTLANILPAVLLADTPDISAFTSRHFGFHWYAVRCLIGYWWAMLISYTCHADFTLRHWASCAYAAITPADYAAFLGHWLSHSCHCMIFWHTPADKAASFQPPILRCPADAAATLMAITSHFHCIDMGFFIHWFFRRHFDAFRRHWLILPHINTDTAYWRLPLMLFASLRSDYRRYYAIAMH